MSFLQKYKSSELSNVAKSPGSIEEKEDKSLKNLLPYYGAVKGTNNEKQGYMYFSMSNYNNEEV